MIVCVSQIQWRVLFVLILICSPSNMSKTVKYFAYGSNLWSQRIRIDNPSAVAKAAALLKDYRLEFTYRTERWGAGGSVANIFPSPNSHLYGVLWDLNHGDLESLDRQEGVPTGIYERIEVTVEVSGEPVKCWSYQITDATRNKSISSYGVDQIPSKVYKDVMVCGAKENNLPAEYITFLKNMRDNGYDGEVQVSIPRDLLKSFC